LVVVFSVVLQHHLSPPHTKASESANDRVALDAWRLATGMTPAVSNRDSRSAGRWRELEEIRRPSSKRCV